MYRADAAAVLFMTLVGSGCSSSHDAARGNLRVERQVIGDTTIVRTVAGSVWGDSVELIEEVSIGVLEGAPEYQFGAIRDIAVDGSGGIYVFDNLAPALRYYDAAGTFVRTLGGEGEGPGEYRDASLGLGVRRSDGRVVMRDPRNARINVYESDGTPSDSWRVASGLFTARAMVLDTADQMYLKILTGRPERNKVWPVALLHLDATGQAIDTLIPPSLPHDQEPPRTFGIKKLWDMSPLGGFVVGVNDRYRIEHHRPDGSVLRIEREISTVAVTPGEKSEYEARNEWLQRTQGQFLTVDLPSVPDTKPAYRSIEVDEDGRVWVHRYMEAQKGEELEPHGSPGMEAPPPRSWHEPNVYDVFDVDGSFLGSVVFPRRFTPSVMKGDRVWGVREGELDEDYVVGYRLAHD